MSRGVSKRTAAVLCVLSAATAFNASYVVLQRQNEAKMPDYEANNVIYKKMGEIRELVDELYVGEYDFQTAVDMASAGFVLGIGDRWSGYLSAEEYKDYQMSLQGQAEGIGVYTLYDPNTSSLHLIEVYPDSGAERAGLKRGDEILGAAGKTFEKDGYQAVLDCIAGDAGTAVELLVRHADTGKTETVSAVRGEVEATMVTGKMLPDQTGYIYIYNFHMHAEEQFERVLSDLLEQGAERLIFDVRENPGGAVDVLAKMLDPLLPEGTIMTLRSKSGEEKIYSSDAQALELPMAVIINENSYSAAEFFAAALQEYGKAVIVGEQTVGKGYSQRTYALSDGSALRLSDNAYYTPKGKSLIGVGVVPDISVVMPEEKRSQFYFLEPRADNQLSAAWDAVKKRK
ncbi:MAG: S41 family peptidase [Butyricicoccus pullicaecorum]|nr:S41 family peptidase [Butyricicoccus pullicaecorum]MDO4668861.1 S41 family peptidase [Butyricicoccus pullicaecorum]